jgi:hypothetical protein
VIICVHTISFLALVNAGAAHGRDPGVALKGVLAALRASWAGRFRVSDLSLCPRSPFLDVRVLHQLRAGAPSLLISLSVGVQPPLLQLWISKIFCINRVLFTQR